MKNRIFANYTKLDITSEEGRRKICGAMSHYMRQPGVVQEKLFRAGVANYDTTSNVGEEIRLLIERYHMGLSEIDSGWMNFFDIRDFSGTRAPGFRIREVSSGLTFEKRPEGGRARIYRITGAEVYATFDTYGGGLEFDQAWFDDQEWWLIEDTAAEFRAKWYEDKAAVMYGLIGAIGAGQNFAFDGNGATALDDDILTLNGAAAQLLTALKARGFAVTASTPIRVLSPIQLRGRLQRALAAQYITPATAGANLRIEYNISPVYSMNVLNAGAASTDKWYMAVPGMKCKVGEKMDLTVWAQFKAEAYATTTVGWGRYAAYLNEEQVLRVSTA